jgi:hypothetical protein
MDQLNLIYVDDVLDKYLREHGLKESIRLGDLPLRARREILQRTAQLASPKKGTP